MSYTLSRNFYVKLENSKIFSYTGFYAFMITNDQLNSIEMVENILRDCWHLSILNVIVLVHQANFGTSSIELYTFYPYTIQNCDTVIATKINVFPSDSLQFTNKTIFPRKVNNFNGCPLTVVVTQLRPLMYFTKLENNSYHPDGIDGALIKALSMKLNFKLIAMPPSDNAERGVIYPNGTMTGAAKMVIIISI